MLKRKISSTFWGGMDPKMPLCVGLSQGDKSEPKGAKIGPRSYPESIEIYKNWYERGWHFQGFEMRGQRENQPKNMGADKIKWR